MQIDFHRARVGAGSAERRRVGKMVELVNSAQMRSKDAADRPRIRGAVGVTAHGAENRADVEASAAADAMQHIALLDVREQFGSAIIEQDDVKFSGSVDFVWLARAANQRVIATDRL